MHTIMDVAQPLIPSGMVFQALSGYAWYDVREAEKMYVVSGQGGRETGCQTNGTADRNRGSLVHRLGGPSARPAPVVTVVQRV